MQARKPSLPRRSTRAASVLVWSTECPPAMDPSQSPTSIRRLSGQGGGASKENGARRPAGARRNSAFSYRLQPSLSERSRLPTGLPFGFPDCPGFQCFLFVRQGVRQGITHLIYLNYGATIEEILPTTFLPPRILKSRRDDVQSGAFLEARHRRRRRA
jgi:hypothetical protein